MQHYVRPLILLGLASTMIYLALQGDATAIAAVVSTFSTLGGALWGERSALKVPGAVAEPPQGPPAVP